MEETPNPEKIKEEAPQHFFNQRTIHQILAHSYLIYFGVFVLGIFLDLFFEKRVHFGEYQFGIGYFLLLTGTLILIWAQKTSRKTHGSRNSSERSVADFMKGPYKYTRIPTQIALLVMIGGFGVLIGSYSVIVAVLSTFIIMKLTFVRKEEKRLEEKYGEVFLEYKKRVIF